jgi:hypothetical protein
MQDDTTFVWLLPISRHITITDLPGVIPLECCNVPERYSNQLKELTGSTNVNYEFETWYKALDFVYGLTKEKLKGWHIEYDNWLSRQGPMDETTVDFFDGDY